MAHLKIMIPTNYSVTTYIYFIYMYKKDLVLNNPQGLICHKHNQPNNYLISKSDNYVSFVDFRRYPVGRFTARTGRNSHQVR